MKIVDLISFKQFFKQLNKNVTLFFDEFDLLLSSPFIQNFLDLMRGIKHSMENITGILSIVLIGPSKILLTGNFNSSSFNVNMSYEAPYFDLPQVENLFQDFCDTTKVRLEDGIVQDIFDRTSGHPGLVCFCGLQIQNTLLRMTTSLSLSVWKQFAIVQLPM